MTLGETEADVLAYELAQTDFDAVERDGLRAAWSADGRSVTVVEIGGGDELEYDGDELEYDGDELEYDGEDLVRATSDREVSHARNDPRT